MTALDDALLRARQRPGFMDRLAKRVVEDRHILDRLRDLPEPASYPQVAIPWPAPDRPICRHCGRAIALLVRRWIHLDEWEAPCGDGTTCAEPNL